MIYFYKLRPEISTINKLRTTISKKKEMQENYNFYRVDELKWKYRIKKKEEKVKLELNVGIFWKCYLSEFASESKCE